MMIRQRPKGTTGRPTGATGITATAAAATTSSGTTNATPGKSSNHGTDDGGRHVTISFDQAPKTRIMASSLASSRRRNTKATATATAGHHQHQQRHQQLPQQQLHQQPHVVIVMDHHSYHHHPSQLMAPTPKPPRMILDKEYKDYLAGSIMTTQRKGPLMVTPLCAAKTCSYVSLVGTVFLVRTHCVLHCVLPCIA